MARKGSNWEYIDPHEVSPKIGTPLPDCEITVIQHLYSEKKRVGAQVDSKGVKYVSLVSFGRELKHFDREMYFKHGRAGAKKVVRLMLKKCTERIVKGLWRMPFPIGLGSLYVRQKQTSSKKYATNKIRKSQINLILAEARRGLSSLYLKWNKDGIHNHIPYKNIWRFSRSQGLISRMLFEEVYARANDPEKKNYRGHID